ncbi:MAG: hypothetical protein NC420_01810 [Eubacterium sp.]|nr:hypothetical protein [Eubacterium sp.]MCM1215538.1 hypothetical protein [Lachnospiraceae bacterium]MCM1239335.1 hypothetical protein [Lachnospiraceae bacterium]
MKKMIYLLLPLQVLILLLSPRFGWKMHNPESIVLSYGGTVYADGKIHTLYQNENESVDISYENLFSKKFLITINDKDEYEMEVGIDGATYNDTNSLHFTDADIIWNDSCGIFWWRYILTIAMTIFSILLVKRKNRINIFSCILYVVSFLISFRILF